MRRMWSTGVLVVSVVVIISPRSDSKPHANSNLETTTHETSHLSDEQLLDFFGKPPPTNTDLEPTTNIPSDISTSLVANTSSTTAGPETTSKPVTGTPTDVIDMPTVPITDSETRTTEDKTEKTDISQGTTTDAIETQEPTADIALEKGNSCTSEGLEYDDGESVPTFSPCQDICVCNNGSVNCEQLSCPPSPPAFLRCVPQNGPDECCPSYSCPSVSPRPPSPNCIRDDIQYNEGEYVPNPELCTDCYCLDGEIICAFLECSEPPNANCKPIGNSTCCPEKYDCVAGSSTQQPAPLTVRPTPLQPVQRPTHIVPTPPPIPIRCEGNNQCPFDKTCTRNRPPLVCSSGTTVNSTLKCTNLQTEEHTALPPIAGPIETVVDSPIFAEREPIPYQTYPLPIPHQPTLRPSLPRAPKPPMIPIIQLITIGCENYDDCPFNNSCINKLCFDPCNPGICGNNADCNTLGNRPICVIRVCSHETTGNSSLKCITLQLNTEEHTTLPPIPGPIETVVDLPIFPGKETSRPHKPPVGLTTLRPSLPPAPKPPLIPIIQSNPIGCGNNDGCPFNNSCINKLCLDSCNPGICGNNANCLIQGCCQLA